MLNSFLSLVYTDHTQVKGEAPDHNTKTMKNFKPSLRFGLLNPLGIYWESSVGVRASFSFLAKSAAYMSEMLPAQTITILEDLPVSPSEDHLNIKVRINGVKP